MTVPALRASNVGSVSTTSANRSPAVRPQEMATKIRLHQTRALAVLEERMPVTSWGLPEGREQDGSHDDGDDDSGGCREEELCGVDRDGKERVSFVYFGVCIRSENHARALGI